MGANSYTSASKLGQGEYVSGMNIICRGGIAQTRPGSRSLLNIPSGNLQGIKLFKPTLGQAQLVFAVDGLVYVSNYPFESYSQLEGIQFNKYSKYIAWAVCLQSTYYDASGVLKFLENPISTLVMQDGNTRAAFWNGTEARHLNPTVSSGDVTTEGFDETPVGLWMCWSNNRLWVSREGQIFASDIGNPLKFTETQYLNEGRAFYLSGPCTGIVETSDQQGIICFTLENGVFLRSSIQNRTQWLSTPEFQQTVLPNVGCSAPRSIVNQYGLIWWYSSRGLINQNDALRLNITSRLDIQDNEMAASKAYMSFDLSGVCGATHENFLFHAVPYGGSLNTRIHVLDQAPFEGNDNSWPSYWTGWRPVEITYGVISSRERVFTISADYDGVNRIWELFREDKTDNGIPITCYVQTRNHFFGNRDYKKFKYAEVELCNIEGDVSLKIAAGSLKGAYQTMMTKDIVSTIGQVYPESEYSDGGNLFAGTRAQTRIVRTTDSYAPSECNSVCIESEERGLIDKAFSILIVWSGVAGISAYRIFSLSDTRSYQGVCEDNETGILLLNEAGCGTNEPFLTTEGFERFYASATVTASAPDSDVEVSKVSIQSSSISQSDADRKALATARWYVYSALGYEV